MGSSKTRKTKFAFFLRFLVQKAPTHLRGRFFFQAPLASVLRHGGLPVLGRGLGASRLKSVRFGLLATCYLWLVMRTGRGPTSQRAPQEIGHGREPPTEGHGACDITRYAAKDTSSKSYAVLERVAPRICQCQQASTNTQENTISD
jgi:hypothetical protein